VTFLPVAATLSLALLAPRAHRPPAAPAPEEVQDENAPMEAEEGPPLPQGPRDPLMERFAALRNELRKERKTPRGLAILARLHDLEDDLPELAHLAAVYGATAWDHRAPPEVRSLARFYLASLERARGNFQKSADAISRLGFVHGWMVAGPFDNEGKNGLDVAFPPEKGLEPGVKVPGKVRDVSWRALPGEAQSMGQNRIGEAFRPTKEACFYSLAFVDLPADTRGILWLGASGASKIWLNGTLALADPAYHPARFDQVGAPVNLKKGANRLLVKICHAEGQLAFYLRLAQPGGDGLAFSPVAIPPLPTGPKPPRPPKFEKAPPRYEGALAALEKKVRAAKTKEDEGRARLDLAVVLAEKRPFDEKERREVYESRRAAELLPQDVQANLFAARYEDEDQNRRKAWLEAALAAEPTSPSALAALGTAELNRGHPHRAVPLLEKAVTLAPGYVNARIQLAQARDQAGLQARAELDAMELARQFPYSPPAIAAVSRNARRLDRPEEAIAAMRKQLALRYDDENARRSLTQLLVDRGDLEGALEQIAVSLRLDPSDTAVRLRRADLLAANERVREAEEEYLTASRICPDEADIYERRGHVRLREGRVKEAVADFGRALDLRPQNPQLKELVRTLQPENERFQRSYEQDGKELAKTAPKPEPDEDALILAEVKVTKVFGSGLSATFQQNVVKVFTQRGAEEQRQVHIGYAPDRQEVKVERARVIKPDGTVVEAHQESERSMSEPWYSLYYDSRSRVLTFPTLGPGDVLDVSWRLDDVAGENLLSDYYGDLSFIQENQRKSRFDYVLLMPPGRKIYANAPALPNVVKEERAAEGGTLYRWTVRDIPRIDAEPGMPGWSEVSPYLHVSTYADWKQVGVFYWGLVRDQLKVTPLVKETADKIAREALGGRARTPADDLLLVRAVYDFVVTNTRYVGLEFGIHGYKPYKVDQILTRRFGDCKDKASTVRTLLEALGIDSRLVLLRMKRLGKLPESPASLAIFNHAILYVPKFDLWLDGTAAYSGSRELPGEDRGAVTLVVNPGDAPRFGLIPEVKPDENLTQVSFDVQLAEDGTATVSGQSTITGTQAPGYRRAYQAENERRASFEQAWSRTFPGLKVDSVALSDLTRLEDDVTMKFKLSVPRYAQKDGDTLRFTPFGGGHTYVESYAAMGARRYDLVLGEPWTNRFRYRYALPPGWEVAELPESVEEDGPLGRFSVKYRLEGGMLVADGNIVFKVSRVAAKDYPSFRELAAKIDQAMARKVKVARRAGAAAGGAGR
jgi:tetratricopeptide (TPR) repeat protein/transglutaminase-like putative cysteine protease